MRKGAKHKTLKSVKILSSKVAYRGPVFQVTTDLVKEPGGATVRRDVIRHSGSVVIMAVDYGAQQRPKAKGRSQRASSGPRVLLARQYRYAANDWLWELPAGRIDEGEEELAAAKRELLEETGYAAHNWKRVIHYYASPGFLDETMSIYLAQELKAGKATPEEDEFISKRFFSLPQAVQMIMRGAIRDGKTIAGVLWFAQWAELKGWRKAGPTRANQ